MNNRKEQNVIDAVIVIHGRGSSADKSTTVNSCREYFAARGYEFVAPTYETTLGREENEIFFGRFIASLDRSKTYAVIGCSMGGYWARYVANRLLGSRLVMINPSLRVFGEDDQKDDPDMPIFVWLTLDDDVVDPSFALNLYRHRAKVRVFNEGGHRFPMLKDHLSEIEGDINIVQG